MSTALNEPPHPLVTPLADRAEVGSAHPAPDLGAHLLDQKNTNAFSLEDALSKVPDGGVVLKPHRSGGALDRWGKRQCDVWQADDLVGVVDSIKTGRWIFITLTTGREGYTGGWLTPEMAYHRCNPRVSKVMRRVCTGTRIYFTGVEVQERTGEGWVHWHILAWLPPSDTRTVEHIKADALKRWRIYTEHETVDQQTGEVRIKRRYEPIGCNDAQHFEVANSREGVARYICKYIVKRWNAVPTWLLESRGRFRCMRFSEGAFVHLERLGRHDRQRGRRKPRASTTRPARTILQRLAASGAYLDAFRRQGDRLTWCGTVEVPVTELEEIRLNYQGEYARAPLGSWHKGRLALSAAAFDRLKHDERRGVFTGACERYALERAEMIAREWEEMQHGQDFGSSGVEAWPVAGYLGTDAVVEVPSSGDLGGGG